MKLLDIFRKKHHLGLLGKDPYDSRDYQLASIQKETTSLPDTFDLREKMTSVENQHYGSCTANMADGLKEFLDSKEYNKEIKLSQKFIYHNTKKISGLWGMEGDYLRNALLSVCKYGAPLEKTYPDIKRSNWEEYAKEEPSNDAYKEAEKYKGSTFWSVGKTLDNFRQAIFQQKAPIGFGMMWYSSYNKPDNDGKLPLPDKQVGGHALVAVGWDNEKLWVRNSWGVKWGLNGYFYIPFSEFTKHDFWDAWCLTDIIEIPGKVTGWAAEKYLTEISAKFHPGDIITPTTGLNLREKPTINSNKITLMKPGQELKVLEKNSVKANGYNWWPVKIK
jgi:C1A family cysteine protease